MLFPPVAGIVPDAVAVDVDEDGDGITGDGGDPVGDEDLSSTRIAGADHQGPQLGDRRAEVGRGRGDGFVAGQRVRVRCRMSDGGRGRGPGRRLRGFCERWEWGVRALVQNANALAQRLGLAAGMVHEEDQYWGGTLKVGLNSLVGNPHATEEEVAQQSWGDIVTPDDLTRTTAPSPSVRPRRRWARRGRTPGGRLPRTAWAGCRTTWPWTQRGISEEQREQARDDLFGPSPEERAQHAAAGSGG